MNKVPATTSPERFCPQCGRSREPLKVPHLSTECKECGRTVHFVRPGEDGVGIKVEEGERFTIPSGFIQLSLEPKPNAKMFRPGIPFLLNVLFLSGAPSGPEEMVGFVAKLEKEFDKYVEETEAAKGRDWTTEEDLKELAERLSKDKTSRDWYMFSAAMFCGGVTWSIENGNPQRAAWTAYMLGTMRALGIVTEPLFEETLWRGYLANEVIFEAAAAAGNRNPAEIEALKRLRPLFEQFDEATLAALVESGVPIGPKINVKAIPEELLRALAKFQLASIERERDDRKEKDRLGREEAAERRKEQRERRDLRIKWFTAGVTACGAVVAMGTLAWNVYSGSAVGRVASGPLHAASAPASASVPMHVRSSSSAPSRASGP